MDPLLKWAGGKRWQIPLLRDLVSPEVHLVELFAGGAALAFGLEHRWVTLNDANRHLMNFYQFVKAGLPLPRTIHRAKYYNVREVFNSRINSGIGLRSRQQAEDFYYLNRFGFNGLCRFNRDGEFNVPIGRGAATFTVPTLKPYQQLMLGWVLEEGDFEEVEFHRGDFVYADPPYDDGFTAYTEGDFGWGDQARLAARLARHSGPVIATNLATPRILDLYRGHGFVCYTAPAPRRISRDADGRTPVRELIATNFSWKYPNGHGIIEAPR